MTVVELAPPKLRSYTGLTTYHECPWQYKLKYIDRLRDDPAVWNIGGVAFHQCVEWILTHEGPATTVEGLWAAAWDLALDEVRQRNPDAGDHRTWRAANQGREHIDWWMREGPNMVERFIEWRRTIGKDFVVLDQGVEHRFEVDFGGVPVVAIPDLLAYDEFGQLNILDWKSGRRDPKGSLQLAVYKTAVLYGWGMEAVWGHFYRTRTAKLIPIDLTVWQPGEIIRMFTRFDANVRAENFPPTPGDHCKFCPATREHCSFSPKEPT